MARDLLKDAQAIWWAGVEAVRPEALIRANIQADSGGITVCGERFERDSFRRLVVIGAGKAGGRMAAALESILLPLLGSDLSGWVNVPEDCVEQLQRIHLHGARPAGLNKPHQKGVEGVEQMLRLVETLTADDICLIIISGGGSALLPAPPPGVSLADKLALINLLEDSGADICELNTVRKQVSLIKGGGLAEHIRAGRSIALILSDVIGDPLDIIASGPTVPSTSGPQDALEILRRRNLLEKVPSSVLQHLKQAKTEVSPGAAANDSPIRNVIIGSNELAIEAAAAEAKRLGYAVYSYGSEVAGDAEEVGAELIHAALAVRDKGEPIRPPACLLSGGEPTVILQSRDVRGIGGRNQQLVLGALQVLWNINAEDILLLSGGTDGEDGPTDAAGGWADKEVVERARAAGLMPECAAKMNDAYQFLGAAGGLFKTGPTQTNVMDLRVVLVYP